MERHIRIIHGFQGSKKDSVCFMTSAGQNEVNHFTFEDRLQGTALRLLYERICLGSSFPPEMIINGMNTPNHAFAAALFTDPSLVLKQECLSLISSFDLFHKWSDLSYAHIPETHLRIIQEVNEIIETEEDTLESKHRRLANASTLIESYLSFGNLPLPRVDTEKDLIFLKEEGSLAMFRSENPRWGEFYKHGFLCGIWLSPTINEGFERPIIFKKSSFVSFDLQELGRSLNSEEFSIEGNQGVGWLSSNNPNFLVYPSNNPVTGTSVAGTTLPIEVVWKNAEMLMRKKQ